MTALDVTFVSPEAEVWSGTASFVSARTVTGSLGILPEHEQLVAVLADDELAIDTSDGRTTWNVRGGFIHVGATENGSTPVRIMAEAVEPT